MRERELLKDERSAMRHGIDEWIKTSVCYEKRCFSEKEQRYELDVLIWCKGINLMC